MPVRSVVIGKYDWRITFTYHLLEATAVDTRYIKFRWGRKLSTDRKLSPPITFVLTYCSTYLPQRVMG